MYCYDYHEELERLNETITTSIIRRGGIIIPAKAMPRPLSLPGSALILLSAKIPSTKAGSAVKPLDGKITIAQTREAIARRS
jgi:hypothetical protein